MWDSGGLAFILTNESKTYAFAHMLSKAHHNIDTMNHFMHITFDDLALTQPSTM